MADIRTREMNKGTIRTLDRAAAASHRIKNVAVRSKAEVRDASDSSENSRQHAIDRMTGNVEAGTLYAARGGSNLVQQAYREYGSKTIRRRQAEARLADEEIARISNACTASVHIRSVSGESEARLGTGVRSVAKGRQKPLKTASTSEAVLRQREYGLHKLKLRLANGGNRQLFGKRSGRKVRKTGERFVQAVKKSGTFLKSLTAGGVFSVVIIIVMILFGAALTMNEDGSYISGSGDATLVEVARGELGNVGGDKFWKWYGFNSHVHWCACFVSWCADQCGYIETGIIPKFAVVGDGANWFKAHRRWAGRGYKPSPGDIIFFDFEQDGLLDHVGIVETCDGKVVTTIEGNSGNACKRQSYRVGSSQIAGYGLVLIPGGGNKAQMIARKAIQLAYPNAPNEAKYHGGNPTAAYAAALKRAYPNRSGWGQPSKDGASCDVFVGVCLVDSGVDKDFPRGYRDQAIRLAKRTDLYECVISTTSRNIKESELKDGDICTWEKSSGTVHIWIYAGSKSRQASHDKWYPRTTAPGNNLKIKGKTIIRVYRVKG